MPAEGTMGSPERAALVFAGGDPPSVQDLPTWLQPEFVIAADSGLEHALALGFAVDLVVGDLDSVDPTALDVAVAAGVEIERHPAAKDATDLELALDTALARGATRVFLLGAHGGRFDHFLANMLLLASPRFASAQIEARFDGTHVSVVRDHVGLAAHAGALCSLLPVGGPATGVRTEGLRFPLRGETLSPGTTRGVSNEFLGSTAAVSLDSGVLLVVIPLSGTTASERNA
jgi:thiamine pyrophosphokinase